jgi:EAL domain-containing protein (putative c-di-GMP-specific phosphodiesterase class I)
MTPSRVLLVDDDHNVTASLELALRKWPFQIRTANSAHEGLRILRDERIDVVVSDDNMPGMRGSEFLSLVRQMHPDTIRIILTGQPSLKSAVIAINEAKADRLLLKPSSPEEIARCISGAASEREREREESHERSQSRFKARLESELDLAIHLLWMDFQPVVRAADMRVFAYEALVRSAHASLNTPERLFDAAREVGRTFDLERAIRVAIAARVCDLPHDAQLLVNVHPESLGDEALYSTDSPMFPFRDRVIFEITERDKFDVLNVQERLNRVRSLGYRLAIDDLGAGYAGLTWLVTIQPDVVKFDRELICDVQLSPPRMQVIRFMNELCHAMGILSIAEGIESRQEYETLIGLGCDLLQGFFIARPSRDFS